MYWFFFSGGKERVGTVSSNALKMLSCGLKTYRGAGWAVGSHFSSSVEPGQKKKINTEKRLSSPYRKAKLKRFPLKNTQEIHFLGKVIEFFFSQSEEFLAYSLKQTKWESSPQVGTTWYRPPTLPLLVSTFSSTFTKAVGLVGQQCLSG